MLYCFHELLSVDYPREVEFCQWFQKKKRKNEDILTTVSFLYAAWFYLSGYFNSQNKIWGQLKNFIFFVEEPLYLH